MKVKNTDRWSRRKLRVSAKLHGSKEKPRVVIFRSNKYIYSQAVDDTTRKTIAASSALKIKKMKKTDQAREVGKELAKILKVKGISQGIFDRGPYTYNGRVKALAEGLREGGIKI
jgi:large subunit ribosomal protein L18